MIFPTDTTANVCFTMELNSSRRVEVQFFGLGAFVLVNFAKRPVRPSPAKLPCASAISTESGKQEINRERGRRCENKHDAVV